MTCARIGTEPLPIDSRSHTTAELPRVGDVSCRRPRHRSACRGQQSCPHEQSAFSRASCRHRGGRLAGRAPSRVERCQRTTADHPHDDDRPPSTPLRSPPSRSRPRHRGREHCHESWYPSVDGPGMAGQGSDGRGQRGRDEPNGIGTPAGSPGASATHEEDHPGPAPHPRSQSGL